MQHSQRLPNIKMARDLFYSLKLCFNINKRKFVRIHFCLQVNTLEYCITQQQIIFTHPHYLVMSTIPSTHGERREKKERIKVSFNNGQLSFQSPLWAKNANHLDQKLLNLPDVTTLRPPFHYRVIKYRRVKTVLSCQIRICICLEYGICTSKLSGEHFSPGG